MPHSIAVPTAAPGTAPSPVVIDLRSRHEEADVAAGRMFAIVHASTSAASPVRVHKIDSTLRGNWPAEIAAATRAGRRVMLVPAFPAAGRICRGGIVTEHGVPVDRSEHADDPRRPALTSRPASLLPDAAELATARRIEAWLTTRPGAVAVADAGDDDELATVVQLCCAHDDVLLVGTAAVVGAAARHWTPPSQNAVRPILTAGALATPVLVVCGSLHPVSRGQVEALLRGGAVSITSPGSEARTSITANVSVLASSPRRADDPSAIAASLADHAHRLVRSLGVRTVVLLGGDTAQAFIGDRVVHVAGSLGVGVALGSIAVGELELTLVTKPGAFGSTNTLVDLMHAVLTGPVS